MAQKTQLRVEVVADGAAARTDLKQTETQVGQLEKQFGSLQSKLLGLASTASGLDLSKIGGIASGVIGTAGEAAGGLASGGGLMALAGPAAAATAGLGALVVAGKSATDSVRELAGETKQLGLRTGLTAEDASALLAVFKRFGVDGHEASQMFVRLSRNLAGVTDASQQTAIGMKSASAVMNELGVQVRDADGHIRPLNQLILDTADGFKRMADGPEKTAAAVALFGKSGADLLPVLNQGSEGIKELEATAKRLGLTLTGDNMAAVKQYSLAHKDMNEAFEGLKLTLGTALMPILAELAKNGRDFAVDLNETLIPALKSMNAVTNGTSTGLEEWRQRLFAFGEVARGADVGVAQFERAMLRLLEAIPNSRAEDDPYSAWLKKSIGDLTAEIDRGGLEVEKAAKKTTGAAADAYAVDSSVFDKVKGYGSDLLTAYLQGMTPDGMAIYGDIKKVAEKAMKGMSPTGKVDTEKLAELAPLFAQIAQEIERTGTASDTSWAALQAALGGESQQVKELVADYQALAADKLRVKQVTADIHALESQQRADTAQATRENRELQRGITEAQHNQSEADKAEAENVRGLTEAQKGLGFAQKDSAAAGVAALVPLNAELKSVQESAATVALGYKSQNDELQRQIDLNNQIVGQLEHQRDVKFLAIDERLAEIGKSRDVNDLREAATLRRERATIERDTKPQIELERERATVENYGLTQAQKGISDKAKAASDASAAQSQSLQAQITAQTEHNAAVQAGFQRQIEESQKVIDNATNAARVRHDDDNQRIVDLQEVATATAQFWQDRQAADTASITAARESLTFWQGQVTEANTLLTTVKAINAEIAASGQFGQLPIWMRPTSGGTQGDNPNGDGIGGNSVANSPSAQGGGRDAREDGSGASGNEAIGTGSGGGGRGFTEMSAPHTYNFNMFGVGEADQIARLTAAIQRISAA